MPEITDKFGKASANDAASPLTVVATSNGAGDTVLQCHDLSAFSDTHPVFYVTYRKEIDPQTNLEVKTRQCSYKALVNRANNSLTNIEVAPGYADVSHAPGDYVECIPTGFWANSLIDGIETSHNPDGTIKQGIITGGEDGMIGEKEITAHNVDLATFGTGWTMIASGANYNGNLYAKEILGIVYLRGTVTLNSGNMENGFSPIPTGGLGAFAPTTQDFIVGARGTAQSSPKVRIATDGSVQIVGTPSPSTTNIVMDSVSYPKS